MNQSIIKIRKRFYEIIFESDTRAGRIFDEVLLIVILTTVGYGDLAPSTGLGQFLSSLVMILGYSVIAVPAGMITAKLLSTKESVNTQVCSKCMFDKHDDDAHFCKKCGTSLDIKK